MKELNLGIKEFHLLSFDIDEIHQHKKLTLPDQDSDGNEIIADKNQYAIFRSIEDPKHSALARYLGDRQWQIVKKLKELKLQDIDPKDSKQSAFVDCLTNDKVLLSVCIGSAGTGKTTLALAFALQEFLQRRRKIILVKPTVMVGEGNAFGPVPGDIQEKYAPYLTSYEIVLKKVGRLSKEYLEQMKQKEELQFFPLELARGCTFENCTLILDEAQNLSWHELNTLISRIGENSKMIILGDLHQIDTGKPYWHTGLYKLLLSPPFKHSSISSAIELTTQYRSAITQLVTEVNKWISDYGKPRDYDASGETITK